MHLLEHKRSHLAVSTALLQSSELFCRNTIAYSYLMTSTEAQWLWAAFQLFLAVSMIQVHALTPPGTFATQLYQFFLLLFFFSKVIFVSLVKLFHGDNVYFFGGFFFFYGTVLLGDGPIPEKKSFMRRVCISFSCCTRLT